MLALVRLMNGKNSSKPVGLKIGQTAPNFTARTLGEETMVTLSTYAKQKAVFVFFSTHCKPCRDALPRIEALVPVLTNIGITLVLVSADGKDATEAFVYELGIHSSVLLAPRNTTSFTDDYHASVTPSYCFLEQGIVRSSGTLSWEVGEWRTLTDSWIKTGHSAAIGRR